MTPFQRLSVIGAGAWGTALAQVAARNGSEVTLWAHEPQVAEEINAHHTNSIYLKDVPLERSIRATSDLTACLATDLMLVVVPSQFLRSVLGSLTDTLPNDMPLLLCTKGIEVESLHFMSEVVESVLPQATIGVLSGPSFASEVARGLPTAVTLACPDETLGQALAQAVGAPTFRPYWHADVIGAQVGGAVKNVLAIACGIVTGKGLGDSARAALITRGFAEVTRLGRALGAKPETLSGLSGLGDLVLTCNSPTSRNMSLGIALGEGQSLEDIMSGRRSVAEGVETSFALSALSGKLGVEMPISEAVAHVLKGEAAIDPTIEALLARPFKPEL